MRPQDGVEWSTINVTDPNANQQELILNCTTSYKFMVKAWNALGGSVSPSKAWPIKTGGDQGEKHHSQDTPFPGTEQN